MKKKEKKKPQLFCKRNNRKKLMERQVKRFATSRTAKTWWTDGQMMKVNYNRAASWSGWFVPVHEGVERESIKSKKRFCKHVLTARWKKATNWQPLPCKKQSILVRIHSEIFQIQKHSNTQDLKSLDTRPNEDIFILDTSTCLETSKITRPISKRPWRGLRIHDISWRRIVKLTFRIRWPRNAGIWWSSFSSQLQRLHQCPLSS